MSSLYLLILTTTLVVGCSALNLLPGWTEGMPSEAAGLWIGDEKFIETDEDEPYIGPYCSRAIFLPTQNFLLWLTAEDTCEENGINPLSGSVDGGWFREVAMEDIFIEQVEQYQCMPSSYCDEYDATKNYDTTDNNKFRGWEVLGQSCLQAIKRDNLDASLYYCETRQVQILKRRSRTRVVSTLAYGHSIGGYTDASWCPEGPVFTEAELLENSNTTEGSARFVMVQNFTDLMDPCTWTCYEDKDGKCQ